MNDLEKKMAAEILRLEDGRVTGPESLRVTKLPAADKGGRWEICGICDGIEPAVFSAIKKKLDDDDREGAWEDCLQYVLDNTAAVRSWLDVNAWPGVEFFLRDHFFNAGQRSAAKMLQRALNTYGCTIKADGIVGPATRAAWATVTRSYPDRGLMLTRLRAQRDAYYRSCRQFPTFGKGWLARSKSAYEFALGIA